MARESKRKRDERRFGRPERLADMILQSDWGTDRVTDDDPFLLPREPGRIATFRQFAHQCVAGSTVVVAPGAGDRTADILNGDDLVGPLDKVPVWVPPFKRLFIEVTPTRRDYPDFYLPLRWGIAISRFDVGQPGDIEWLASNGYDLDAMNGARWFCVAYLIGCGQLGIAGPLSGFHFRVARNGALSGSLTYQRTGHPREPLNPGYHQSICQGLAYAAFHVLGLMNCKNVSLESQEPDRGINRERRRAGLRPFIRYNTIVIDHEKASGRNAIGAHHSERALHMVRGHFVRRTIPNEVTYWRSAHVRGSADQGVVVSDYRVNAPNQEA